MVAKRLNAPYQPRRRSEAWRKHEHRHRERLTITAWRPGDRREPDELLVSRRSKGGQLRYAGGVRFGLSMTERTRLRALLERLEHPRALARPPSPTGGCGQRRLSRPSWRTAARRPAPQRRGRRRAPQFPHLIQAVSDPRGRLPPGLRPEHGALRAHRVGPSPAPVAPACRPEVVSGIGCAAPLRCKARTLLLRGFAPVLRAATSVRRIRQSGRLL